MAIPVSNRCLSRAIRLSPSRKKTLKKPVDLKPYRVTYELIDANLEGGGTSSICLAEP
jgi:hypothetical protein